MTGIFALSIYLGKTVDTNLWGWEVCGHAVAQGGRDECAAQDGAHVAGHDFLLLHAAVVLQGEDDWVIRCLLDDDTENTGKEILHRVPMYVL